mgnify:CR=1 FL=1
MDPMATVRLNKKPAKILIFCLILLSALSLFALMFASDSPDEFNRLQTPLLLINILSEVAGYYKKEKHNLRKNLAISNYWP